MKTQLLNKNSSKLKVSTCCPIKRIVKQSALKFFNVHCNVTCNTQILLTSYRQFLSVLRVNNSGGGLLPIMASTRRLRPKGVVFSSFRSIKRVGISPVKKCERVGKSVILVCKKAQGLDLGGELPHINLCWVPPLLLWTYRLTLDQLSADMSANTPADTWPVYQWTLSRYGECQLPVEYQSTVI